MWLLSFLRSLFASPSAPKTYNIPLNSSSKETVRFSVSLDQVSKRKPEELARYRKKMVRKKYRLNRNRLIWAIERHFVEYNTLCHVDNIYDFRRSWEHRENCDKALSEFNPSEKDFVLAYRLIRIKYAQGECVDYKGGIPELTGDILNQVFDIDKEKLLDGMYDRMKAYWDEVVGAYQNDSSRKRRIDYLINRLVKEKQMVFISDCPKVVSKIHRLIEHYSNF